MKVDDSSETKTVSQPTCDIENFKMVADHFNQDLREFWNRANFYLVTNAGLFSAFLIVYPALMSNHLPVVVLVPVLGIAIALLWFFVLRGALHWINEWRKQVIRLSKELDRFQCYYKVEKTMTERRSLSPSYLTTFFPIIFIVAWILILAIVLLGIL